MRCPHLKVKKAFIRDVNKYGSYICPDCGSPIDCQKPHPAYSGNLNGSFRKATWSMAGCGPHWKELQPDGSFKNEFERGKADIREY